MYDGVVTRRSALREMTADDYRSLTRTGRLVPVFRGICIEPTAAPDRDAESLRRRAAIVAANAGRPVDDPDAAYLCCHSAAAEHRLPVGAHRDVFVGVPRSRVITEQRGLVVHRHDCADMARSYGDIRAVPRELAVVQSFTVLPREEGRQLVIRSIQDGVVVASRVRAEVSRTMRGRAELLDLIELAEGGSHSELEIRALHALMQRFGIAKDFERQYSRAIPARSTPMDFAAVATKVNVETDGSRYHLRPDRRSADVRRDLDLQRHGWAVVRCLWENVTTEPDRVARAIFTTLLDRGWRGRPTTLDGRLLVASLGR